MVQAHISRKQDELLTRSVATLTDCSDELLLAQVHRLVGTLGTYQLMDASDLMRGCETSLVADGTSAEDVARIRRTTLEALTMLIEARGSNQEGTSPA
jgi:hypothetical protein